MDLLDLFAVQGTLKSLLQHHSSKKPILLRSVQLGKKKTGSINEIVIKDYKCKF